MVDGDEKTELITVKNIISEIKDALNSLKSGNEAAKINWDNIESLLSTIEMGDIDKIISQQKTYKQDWYSALDVVKLFKNDQNKQNSDDEDITKSNSLPRWKTIVEFIKQIDIDNLENTINNVNTSDAEKENLRQLKILFGKLHLLLKDLPKTDYQYKHLINLLYNIPESDDLNNIGRNLNQNQMDTQAQNQTNHTNNEPKVVIWKELYKIANTINNTLYPNVVVEEEPFFKKKEKMTLVARDIGHIFYFFIYILICVFLTIGGGLSFNYILDAKTTYFFKQNSYFTNKSNKNKVIFITIFWLIAFIVTGVLLYRDFLVTLVN